MRSVVLALALLTLLVGGACSSDGDETEARTASGSVEGTTTGTPASRPAVVRTCESSVYGKLAAAGWRQHSVIAGPVTFYYGNGYAEQPASEFAPVPGSGGRYRGQKMLVLVRPGAVATVVVPETERSSVALLYDPADWNDPNDYRIGDEGESSVTFRACEEGQGSPSGGPLDAMTQFNGGFVVAGARCVPLDIFVPGRSQSIRVTLSFGAGRCE
jgi:hypothetical protein